MAVAGAREGAIVVARYQRREEEEGTGEGERSVHTKARGGQGFGSCEHYLRFSLQTLQFDLIELSWMLSRARTIGLAELFQAVAELAVGELAVHLAALELPSDRFGARGGNPIRSRGR